MFSCTLALPEEAPTISPDAMTLVKLTVTARSPGKCDRDADVVAGQDGRGSRGWIAGAFIVVIDTPFIILVLVAWGRRARLIRAPASRVAIVVNVGAPRLVAPLGYSAVRAAVLGLLGLSGSGCIRAPPHEGHRLGLAAVHAAAA